jgi:SsrA-binding protein
VSELGVRSGLWGGVCRAEAGGANTLPAPVDFHMSKPTKPAPKHFAVNRQAPHLYHLLERFEARAQLTGTEVKSVRDGKINLKDSYVDVLKGEAWLIDCHISPYAAGSYANHDPLRDRRLLLHRQELDKLLGRVQEKGFTLIPTRVYLKKNMIKFEIALAKGKKIYDHREASRQRTIDREAQQDIHEHRRRHT